ncbi:MAG: non-hydrolyzing UDP-N-acetylglucosamine 2-epimerase [Chitinophagales bacterium]
MKKVMVVVGTRPNFIKITQFEKEFEAHPSGFKYTLVHTGQHYDDNMSKIFFEQFQLKKPDYFLEIQGLTPSAQIGKIIYSLDEIVKEVQPDIIMVPGDVNSTLAVAIVANKNGIKLGHIESGLRSCDREMPEEINRILTDEITDHFFITEPSGLENLKKEGKNPQKLHYVGNTMIDTIVGFDEDIQNSPVLEKLNIQEDFALMTMHRPRNVDTVDQLKKLVAIVDYLTEKIKVVLPLHPRTKNRLESNGMLAALQNNSNLVLTGALDYLSFQKLISTSKFVITDSGGIQEETTFRQVPCLTLRNNTERPVTLTEGSNVLVKYEVEDVVKYVNEIFAGTYKKGKIPQYWDGRATERIVEVLDKII